MVCSQDLVPARGTPKGSFSCYLLKLNYKPSVARDLPALPTFRLNPPAASSRTWF